MSLDATAMPLEEQPRWRMPWWGLLAAWAACMAALLPLFFASRWAGGEVAKYQVTTFESASRQALAARDFPAALKYCNGAIKTGHGRSDHWGRVFTLRSLAHAGMGEMPQAAAELVRAGDFFTRRYYYAEPQDRTEVPQLAVALGKRLLAEGKPALALDVFSAGALASGDPVDGLYSLVRTLTTAEREALWGKGAPYISVNAYLDPKDNGPSVVINEQARKIGAPELDALTGASASARFTRITIGASEKDGPCLLALPTYVPVAGRPFGLRVRVHQADPAGAKLLLGYWFEAPQKSATTEESLAAPGDDGWSLCDIRRDFRAERIAEAAKNGYSAEDGAIDKVLIAPVPGSENTISVGRIELYLPQG